MVERDARKPLRQVVHRRYEKLRVYDVADLAPRRYFDSRSRCSATLSIRLRNRHRPSACEASAVAPHDHTFVVPAYGEAPHLSECMESLLAQTTTSRVVISTSTLNSGIEAVAIRYGIEVHEHRPNQGIGHDWNIALAQSRSTWTTLAHQDDVYLPEFAERLIKAGSGEPNCTIAFSDYLEFDGSSAVARHRLLSVKRNLLKAGFRGRRAVVSELQKTNMLRFGSAIPCPAVMYHRRALESFKFREDLRVCLDWAAWLDLARLPGAFVWVRSVLVKHRLHSNSETAAGIRTGTRAREDLELLLHLWPKPVATVIAAAMALAY